jgi:hypothetical protein
MMTQREKTAALMLPAVQKLEEEFADRGLKFTVNFSSMFPLIAHGHLDGERFYFRFRSNHGVIRVGPYNQDVEVLRMERETERYEKNIAEAETQLKSGELTVDQYKNKTWNISYSHVAFQSAQKDLDFFIPTVVTHKSTTTGPDVEDKHKGNLDADEAYNMFKYLITHLETIPEENQIDPYNRIYLYEGLEAAQEFNRKRGEEFAAKFRAMTDEEKRAFAGYPPIPEGFTAGSPDELIRNYRDGDLTRDQVVDQLSRWQYTTIPRKWVDDNAWERIEDALVYNRITQDVYDEIKTRRRELQMKDSITINLEDVRPVDQDDKDNMQHVADRWDN